MGPRAESVPCPSEDALAVYALSGRDDPGVARHVGLCAACRAAIESIQIDARFLEDVTAAASESGRRGQSRDAEVGADGSKESEDVPGYQIVAEVARGGQGIVYRAIQHTTKREVIVKLPLHGRHASLREKHRFEREVEMAAAMRHPNIVSVYEGGVLADGRWYVVMEYIRGVQLDEHAETLGRTRTRESARRLVRVFASIAGAIQHAHALGVIHRDIKPSNILVDAAGNPQIVDFGLARQVQGPRHTATNQFLGTPQYASPEQVSTETDGVDVRTDLYSLGVTMYEAFVGRFPYPVEGSPLQIIRSIIEAPVTLPSELAPGTLRLPIDGDLETILLKSLSRDRSRRYQTAAEFKDDLEAYLDRRPIQARRDSVWYLARITVRRHRAAVIGATMVLLMLVSFSVAMSFLAASRQRDRDRLAEQLRDNTIERARLIAREGSLVEAEHLIWPELHRAAAAAGAEQAMGFEGTPEYLHAYWAMLECYAREPCVRTLGPATKKVFGLVFLADPDRLRSFSGEPGEQDLMIQDWSFTAGIGESRAVRLGALPWHGLCSASNGSAIGVAGEGRLAVIDAASGTINEREEPSLSGANCRAALTADGTQIATIDPQMRLRLWDARTLQLIRDLAQDAVPCGPPAFSADSRTVLAVTDGPSPKLSWVSAETGARLHEVPLDIALNVPADDLNWLVSASSLDHTVVMYTSHFTCWDKRLDRFVPMGPSRHGRASPPAFSADGRFMTIAHGPERLVSVYDMTAGTNLVYSGHASNLWSATINANGSLIASADDDGVIRVWEQTPRAWFTKLASGRETIHSVRFSRDSRRLASAGVWKADESNVMVWDVAGRGRACSLTAHDQVASSADFSPDGAFVCSVGYDGHARLSATDSGNSESDISSASLPPAGGDSRARPPLNFVRFSPDGKSIAIAGTPDVYLFDRDLTLPPRVLANKVRASAVVFSPDGKTLAWGAIDNSVYLWDVASGRIRATLHGHIAPVRTVCFSSDGLLVLTGGDDGAIRKWDTATGEPRGRPTIASSSGVFAVAVHPNGCLIASGHTDGTVRFWDLRDGRQLASFKYHTDSVFSLDFSPDGRHLASGGQDGVVGLWDLEYYAPHIRNNLRWWQSQSGGPAQPSPSVTAGGP